METGMEKDLPEGTGYKSYWIVVQDEKAKLEDIVHKFHALSQETVTYREGVQRAYEESKRICIADLGKGDFYLFGNFIYYFIKDLTEFEKFSKGWNRVALFATYRVVEEHAFAVAEDGKLKRFYYVCGENNQFRVFGEPLEEEIKLEMNLLEENTSGENGLDEDERNLSEEDTSSGNWLDEDGVIDLAIEMTGREAFDYGEAVLLKVGLLREID